MARRDSGDGALYKRADGMWIGAVDLGYGGDGKRRRRYVSSADKATAQSKLRDLRKQVADAGGNLPTKGMTVEKWLTYWLDHICAPNLKPRTTDSYREKVRNHLVPTLGRKRLDRLRPEHVRQMHAAVLAKGCSPTTAQRAHVALVTALNAARREGHVTVNVAELVKAPRPTPTTAKALTAEQGRALLKSVLHDPIGSRWAAALLLGARQGECLGMRWQDVDLDAGLLDLSWQLQRLKFAHGCEPDGKAWACGRKRPGACPQRHLAVPPGFEHVPLEGGLTLTRPKTARGVRMVPIPEPMRAFFLIRRDLAAGPNPHGLVWHRDDGRPVDPSDDHLAWHAALTAAGLPSVPLHAARHTTATLLLEAGVSEHVVQQIIGHSQVMTTRGYQMVRDPLAVEAMGRLGQMLAID